MALPTPVKLRGARVIQMPRLTQTLGPLLAPQTSGKYETRLSNEMEWLRELVAMIPAVDGLTINCHHRFTNWLPFHWAGYQQTTRYTYLIDNLRDLATVYDEMSAKTRNIIRKAQKVGIVVEACDDLERFFPLLRQTFSRQGMNLPFSEDLVRRIDKACAERGARRMFAARDQQGNTHAILYHIFDHKCMYYLMQGSDPALRSSGAALLAQWHAIQYAAQVTVEYDFEGSMIESIEHAFRGFGAIQRPYFTIFRQAKDTSFRGVLGSCRSFVRGTINRTRDRFREARKHG
jgi:lipid II:glycine glycyltransferase (peptidoglycan interpeptide bridge formation enzyme)